MARRQRNTTQNDQQKLINKIDRLNGTINDLVDVLEKLSTNSKNSNDNPFIRPKSNRRNRYDEERKNEWKQYYVPQEQKKKWRDMTNEEKQEFKEEGKKRKESAKDYIRRSRNREEIYDTLRGSRFGSTSIGRSAMDLLTRSQRIDDYGMMGKYMQKNAGKIGTGIFGNGKAGATATKAVGKFGKALQSATKMIGGKGGGWMLAIQIIYEGLKYLGEKLSEWKKGTADIIEHQNIQEQLMYDRDKQKYILENQLEIEKTSYNGDMQLKMLETQGATMLEALKITTAQYAKGVETAIGPLTKGINQSAYDAANARIDAAANIEKLGLHQKQREQDYRLYGEQRGLQYEGKKASTKADIEIAETKYTAESRQAVLDAQQKFEREHPYRNLIDDFDDNIVQSSFDGTSVQEHTNGGNIHPKTGKQMKTPTNTTEAGIEKINNPNSVVALLQNKLNLQPGIHAREQALLHNANGVITRAADWAKTTIDEEYKLAETKKDYAVQVANKQLDIEIQKKEIVIDTATEIKKIWLQLAQKNEEFAEKFDRVTNNLGKSYGYTNARQLNEFQRQQAHAANDVTVFGKSYEDISKLQQTYIETTGRNKLFNKSDNRSITALGEYLGDDGLAANYTSEMEIFNAGVADSVDMLDNVLQDVNRIGLNGRKYTKTLVDSLKLAQKYNFKGGTANLMKMAKWAENTRFNMNSLGGMLDKISDGGLEGVITQGAQFQVLGGNAAMNADPIAMMYERYADPEAFAKRMQDMTKGYGSFDRTTGETKFSGTEQMLMEQLAKIQGRSVEDVMNEVRARNKKEVVSKQLNGNFDEDEQSYISNVATYNKKTGQFEVKVKGKNGIYENKEVNQLTKDDLQNLMPEKHNERMEDYMQTIVDLLGKMSGEENREKIDLLMATYADVIKNNTERLKKAYDTYNANREEYITKTKEGMDEATKAFNDYIGIFENGNKEVQEAEDKITQQANAIGSALENTAKIINEINGKINGDYTPPDSSNQRIRSSDSNSGTYDAMGRLLSAKKAQDAVSAKKQQDASKAISNQTIKQQSDATQTNTRAPLKLRKIPDGVINNNNKPILAQATNVTKVQDGTSRFVQSDRKDSALFAKDGGAFDTLFNGVLNKVEALYDAYTNPSVVSSDIGGLVSDIGGTVKFETLKVELNGHLDLSSGDKSVDIIGELQNNPILLRSLSRMLAQQFSKAFNGGKGYLPISISNVYDFT